MPHYPYTTDKLTETPPRASAGGKDASGKDISPPDADYQIDRDATDITIPTEPTGMITVDGPPVAEKPPSPQLMRLIMPLVMVIAIGGMVAIMLIAGHGSNPMTYLFPLLMLASMVGFIQPNNSGDSDEQRRTYLRYLGRVRTECQNSISQQIHATYFHHPHPSACWQLVGTEQQWHRRPTDDHFLRLRVGLISQAPTRPLSPVDPGPLEDVDPVCAVALRDLLHSYLTIDGLPIALDLKDFPLLYITATDPDVVDGFIRSILAQIVTHHGPDDIALLWLSESSGSLTWLPHLIDEETTTTLRQKPGADYDGPVFVAVINQPTDCALRDHPQCIAIIVLPGSGTHWEQLAKEMGVYLQLRDSCGYIVTAEGSELLAYTDNLSATAFDVLARRLAPWSIAAPPTDSGRTSAPDVLPLVLGVADPRQLQPRTSDQRLRGTTRLRALLGLTPDGQPCYLDLKEAAEHGAGPHGLCVGATGSGKSETLRALVTNLVAHHSPADLNLVLVDFKGGATFHGCGNLPHVAAIITNLADEATLVARMYDALSGELTRRQEFLRRAGHPSARDYNASDIADQHPLPALFIVIDEFSELLSAHPEFTDLFVAIGRLGRSLGVHLLLATQRLEEGKLRGLDAHLSYRIALRTFSASESRAVLGDGSAHTLPKDPGYGLLRVPGEENAQPFRAAYVSADWDADGTIFDYVMQQLSTSHSQAHQIWLPPLPAQLSLLDVPSSRAAALTGLCIPLGVVDMPREQKQEPWIIGLTGSAGHGAIVGVPQSGRSTTLRTMMLSLARDYDPTELKAYIIDFGGGRLTRLFQLPHTVAVATRNEEEKLTRILTELNHLLTAGSGPSNCRRILLIDGWRALLDDYPQLEPAIAQLIYRGLNVGIHVVLTATRWNDIRAGYRDSIGTRIELQLGDPLDSLLDRRRAKDIPAAAGRALAATDSGTFHALVAYSDETELTDIYQHTRDRGDTPVTPLAMLPSNQELTQLQQHAAKRSRDSIHQVLVGIEGTHIQPWYWNRQHQPHMLLIGRPGSGRTNALHVIAHSLYETLQTRQGDSAPAVKFVVLDPRRTLLDTIAEQYLSAYASTTDAITTTLTQLAVTLRQRLPHEDLTAAELRNRSWWTGPEVVVLIDDADLISSFPPSFVDLLTHARDIGLSVVLARRSAGMNRAAYESLMTELRSAGAVTCIFSAMKDDGPIYSIPTIQRIAGRCRIADDNEPFDLHWARAPHEPASHEPAPHEPATSEDKEMRNQS